MVSNLNRRKIIRLNHKTKAMYEKRPLFKKFKKIKPKKLFKQKS